MKLTELSAISPIDGRYSKLVTELQEVFSEYALIKYRVFVEIEWFIHLSKQQHIKELPHLTKQSITFLSKIEKNFSLAEARKVKNIEKKTNHDVKAVEYYLRDQFKKSRQLKGLAEFIHFGCTSEDINNISYALMVKDASKLLISNNINKFNDLLKKKAHQYADIPMVSRTHGQVATPTTVGKELANFSSRIDRISMVISETGLRGKMNGAVGNYNAHLIAYPKVDWEKVSKTFITKVGLLWSPYTTQVEPKDSMAKLFHGHERLNNVLLDFSRDMWGYISLDYFSQKTIKGEVGSSTMPHKINPIDFENAEGNLDLANSIFHYLSSKITKSRWQRDLSDSTSMRNIGSCFAYTLIALSSLIKGLNKLQINKKVINQDLENAWEVLTEAIQTVMRKHHMEGGYEVMKKISRGKNIKKEDLHAIINSLDIPSAEKNKLLKLTPSTYLGLSNKLAKQI
ncbi:MAG: adenylosuccinate lyase [SAR86 cluster bacterium]|nr:adenylosuccinate lyase [SAR86 cluster bacterium]